ncbi:ribosome alternative rescue factor ArfA [Agrobacterium rubi]|nr:ribosome alternative rescue factor ArfA [Agrobacterium rubi]NTF24056.1 ribosome alternative rescue factor ArfA [Agrobacterium rubi]
MKKAVRNAVALDLASRKYAMRIVAKAKGKGSYRRSEKHRTSNHVGASSISGRGLRRLHSETRFSRIRTIRRLSNP